MGHGAREKIRIIESMSENLFASTSLEVGHRRSWAGTPLVWGVALSRKARAAWPPEPGFAPSPAWALRRRRATTEERPRTVVRRTGAIWLFLPAGTPFEPL
jgi:hypothetical protein